jgi:hypothetical protein
MWASVLGDGSYTLVREFSVAGGIKKGKILPLALTILR